ncbi:DUF1640 domain-containing protein [Blumeria hordei DH14]|uniref:DUF1640 domain-containing protein n=1 Tax=Blumeria graminis f. sp. hordei (strain DH14) TaxID=546991 RepID=N1J997_BLUG1|nr:DUF1640 domain-containing protein [Blumeria hordei DH14]
MSNIRLTFLHPYLLCLFSCLKIQRPRTRIPLQYPCQPRNFMRLAVRQAELVRRHGKAVEPVVPQHQVLTNPVPVGHTGKNNEQNTDSEKTITQTDDHNEIQQHAPNLWLTVQSTEKTPSEISIVGDEEGVDAPAKEKIEELRQLGAPLETVLHMPPPPKAKGRTASKPSHIQMPLYLHHFDTYTLVQQVQAGGFTPEQSITAMKAVRSLLAKNLDLARDRLVSKSDVENLQQTYLFRAACSELKTEIHNTRWKNAQIMRRERTLLQHEVDTLNQKLTQELLTLKDDLKGVFDDRKMSVRVHQRKMEGKIQELDYKITVLLNSDSKSEIEGLRWVLTRRSVMGILFMAFMVLTSLQYASYKSHENEMKRKEAILRS